MIAAIWDMLFRYEEALKKAGHTEQYLMCREIENVLQHAYDRSIEVRVPLSKADRKPKDILEALVLSQKDVTIDYDSTDGSIIYNHRGASYENPVQVIKNALQNCEEVDGHKEMSDKWRREVRTVTAKLARAERAKAEMLPIIEILKKHASPELQIQISNLEKIVNKLDLSKEEADE